MAHFKIRQIKSTVVQYFAEFWKIYSTSFPRNERRTLDQQSAIFKKAEYQASIYLSDSKVIGFIAFWTAKEFVFIEHFAIASEIRGKGMGSSILRPFVLTKTKPVILEIDPPVDELTLRRLRFYSSLGFLRNDYSHFQPSYRSGEPPLQLTLLSWPGLISEECYLQFSQFQKNIVMG